MTLVDNDLEVGGFPTRHGSTAIMGFRPSTMDYDVCMSAIVEDEYKLANWHNLEGWALDVGAHIGAVTIALAKDNPSLRVIAVEIVPENVSLIRDNVERNDLDGRVVVVERAAGAPGEISRVCYMRHRSHPQATAAYVNKHRYIGNSFWSRASADDGTFDSEAVTVPSISLSELMAENHIGEFAFMKIDAEGAEWAFLRDPAVSKVRYIIGEFHWDYAGQGDLAEGTTPYERAKTPQAELERLLGPTHNVWVADHPTIGHFEATIR